VVSPTGIKHTNRNEREKLNTRPLPLIQAGPPPSILKRLERPRRPSDPRRRRPAPTSHSSPLHRPTDRPANRRSFSRRLGEHSVDIESFEPGLLFRRRPREIA
jgi:hypothetical protein